MNDIEIVVPPSGEARMVFDDHLDLHSVGSVTIARGSHVEPTADGQWTADLSPVDGPMLGPFDKRVEALSAEAVWLKQNWLIRAAD